MLGVEREAPRHELKAPALQCSCHRQRIVTARCDNGPEVQVDRIVPQCREGIGSPAVAIRLGTETGIETAQLALLATVESLEFTSQGPSHGMFAELGLRLQVYKR